MMVFVSVMYNNFILLHGHQHDESFLRHEFIPVMLDALGLNDNSGVIYEILEHDYFSLNEVGEWDRMMPGMINVSYKIRKELKIIFSWFSLVLTDCFTIA